MPRWDRSRSHDAFLADLSRRGIGPEHLPRYAKLTLAFLRERQDRGLDELGPEDVEAFAAGRPAHEAAAARTAASQFVRFARSGGLVPLAESSPGGRAPAPHEAPRRAPRASSFPPMFADMKRVLSLEGIASALPMSAPILLSLLGVLMSLIGAIIYLAALAAAYFTVLDHVARGRDELPKAGGDNLARNFWRGFMVNLGGAIPLLLVLNYGGDLGLEGLSWFIAIGGAVLVGALLLPAAALAVYASDAGLAAIAPHLWVRIISRMPSDYLALALLYLLLLSGFVLVGWAHVVPMIGWLIVPVLRSMWVLAMAAALGGVVDRNRDELGM